MDRISRSGRDPLMILYIYTILIASCSYLWSHGFGKACYALALGFTNAGHVNGVDQYEQANH